MTLISRIKHKYAGAFAAALVMMSAGLDSWASAAVADGMSEPARRLVEQCAGATDLRRYDDLVRKGDELARLGRADGSEAEELTGVSFSLRGKVNRRDTSDMSPTVIRLETRFPELFSAGEYEAAGYVAKALSLYYHFMGPDYSQASAYAFKALDCYRRAGLDEGEIEALSALASIYFSKNDASGFNYALESYRKAKKTGRELSVYVPASNMANYMFNQGKYREALEYLSEAAAIARDSHMDSEQSYINSFYGDIYSGMNRREEAERYYLKSIESDSVSNKYDRIYSRICYAIFLMRHGRGGDALRQLLTAENMSSDYRVLPFRIQIYNLLSLIYEERGDYRTSLDYYRRGSELRDTIFSREKEREFTLLGLRYKVSEEQRKNAEQGMELMRKNRLLVGIAASVVLLLLALLGGFFYYRKRMRDYRDIVARHLETAETERRLREQLEKALADRKESAAQRAPGLSDDRRQEMFASLEKLMNEEKAYRQTDLSLEKAAAMLKTNRTYLSQIVNECTEGSFSTYINSFRLQEAIELLSDPENDEPLKNVGLEVGFSSPSNFYSLFRQKVGVSPSVFRSNVRNIKNDNKNSQFDNQD